MMVNYVDLTFVENGLSRIVPVYYVYEKKEDSTFILPTNLDDFDPDREYQAKWFKCNTSGKRCGKQHQHKFMFSPANINRLGMTQTELEEMRKLDKKSKRPRKRKLQEHDDEEIQDPTRVLREERLARKKSRKQALHERSSKELTLAKTKITPAPSIPPFEDSDDGDADVTKELLSFSSHLVEKVKPSIQDDEPDGFSTPCRRTSPSYQQTRGSSQPSSLHLTSPYLSVFSPVAQSSQASPRYHNGRPMDPPEPRVAREPPGRMIEQLPAASAALTAARTNLVTHGNTNGTNPIRYSNNRSPRIGPASAPTRTTDQRRIRGTGATPSNTRPGLSPNRATSSNMRPGRVASDQTPEQQGINYRDGYGVEPRRRNFRARTGRVRRSRRHLILNSLEYFHKKSGQGYAERRRYRYSVDGEDMHLTRDILVDHYRWNLLISENDKTFIEMCTRIIFTHEEIIDMALDPTQVKNFIPGRTLQLIDHQRLMLLITGLYFDYVNKTRPSISASDREQLLIKSVGILSRFISEERERALMDIMHGAGDVRHE